MCCRCGVTCQKIEEVTTQASQTQET